MVKALEVTNHTGTKSSSLRARTMVFNGSPRIDGVLVNPGCSTNVIDPEVQAALLADPTFMHARDVEKSISTREVEVAAIEKGTKLSDTLDIARSQIQMCQDIPTLQGWRAKKIPTTLIAAIDKRISRIKKAG